MSQSTPWLRPSPEEYAQIPWAQRNVLFAFEAKTPYLMIAAQQGIPLGTVRSRLHRARKAILKLRTPANAPTQA